jgi:hypothetical protein
MGYGLTLFWRAREARKNEKRNVSQNLNNEETKKIQPEQEKIPKEVFLRKLN